MHIVLRRHVRRARGKRAEALVFLLREAMSTVQEALSLMSSSASGGWTLLEPRKEAFKAAEHLADI